MASAKRTFQALLVAVLAMGFAIVTAPPVHAASQSIALYGSSTGGWGLSSSAETIPGPKLTVAQGDSVTITLHSSDGLTHEFFIDFNGDGAPSAGEPTSSQFNASTTVPVFTATQAGTFTYYCYFHPNSMKGTFTVTSANTGSSGSGGSLPTLEILGIVVVVVVAIGVAALVLRQRSKGT